jgi:hypothetical protein
MGKIALSVVAFLLCGSSSLVHAQKRVEAGLLLDYLNVSQTKTDNVGVGGRFGYRVHRNVMVEGELTYSYGVNFQELYRDISNGRVAAVEQASIGVTDGLLGPTLERARGHLHPFVTVKGGFIDFRLSPSLLPYSGAVSTVLGIRTSNTNALLYAGGGAEATLGPIGLRGEAGDAIYFNDGGHNNLRITFGPILRF